MFKNKIVLKTVLIIAVLTLTVSCVYAQDSVNESDICEVSVSDTVDKVNFINDSDVLSTDTTTDIKLDSYNIKLGNTVSITGTVKVNGENIDKKDIYYYINDVFFDKESPGKSLDFTPGIAGTYKIYGEYRGYDSNLWDSSRSNTCILTVSGSGTYTSEWIKSGTTQTSISIETSKTNYKFGESVSITPTVTGKDDDEKVHYFINGVYVGDEKSDKNFKTDGTYTKDSYVIYNLKENGTYSVYAIFEGKKGKVSGSLSSTVTFTVGSSQTKASTQTTLSVSPSQTTPGSSVTLSAGVTSNGLNVKSGYVSYYYANGELIKRVANIGSCTITPSSGSYEIYAVYEGDSNYYSSTSDKKTLTVTNSVSNTLTTLSISSFAIDDGDDVTLTATVMADGVKVTAGYISYYANDNLIGRVANTGSYTYKPVGGSYSYYAVYEGVSGSYTDSTSNTVSLNVASNTTTTLTVTPSSTTVGKTVTLNAVVTSYGEEVTSGFVRYYSGNTLLVQGTAGQSVTYTFNEAGSIPVYASYQGISTIYKKSNSTVQYVDVGSDDIYTLTSLKVSKFAIDEGEEVTLKVTVTYDYDKPVTEGYVSYYANGELIGRVANVGNYTYKPAGGSYSYYAIYEGLSGSYLNSTSNTESLNVASNTTTTLTIMPSSISVGKTVILKADVVSHGEAISSGFVRYYSGNTFLVQGIAGQSVTYTFNETGIIPIYASYQGISTIYKKSNSGVENLTVLPGSGKLPTETSLFVDYDSDIYDDIVLGQEVTLSVVVNNVGGSQIEEGDVSYYINDEFLAKCSINEEYTFNASELGYLKIYAVYEGDDIFDTSDAQKEYKVGLETVYLLSISKEEIRLGETVIIFSSILYNNVAIDEGYIFYDYDFNGSYMEEYIGGEELPVGTYVRFKPTQAGEYEIYLNYDGEDSDYASFMDSITLIVNPTTAAETSTELSIKTANGDYDVRFGESVTLKAYVYDLNDDEINSGYVSYYYSNNTLIERVANVGECTFTPQDLGNFEVYAVYEGTSAYLSSISEDEDYNVFMFPDLNITLSRYTVNLGDTITIYSSVKYNGADLTEGSIYYDYDFNGSYMDELIGDDELAIGSSVTFTPDRAGEYEIYINYVAPGGSNYATEIYESVILTVKNKSVTTTELIISNTTVKFGTQIILKANVFDGDGLKINSGNILYYYSNNTLIKNVSNVSEFKFTPAPGNYEIYAVYEENDDYINSTSDIKSFSVKIYPDLEINLSEDTITLGENVTLSSLVQFNGININAGSVNYTYYYDGEPEGVNIGGENLNVQSEVLFIPSKSGIYEIYINYIAPDDSIYMSNLNKSVILTVKPSVVKIATVTSDVNVQNQILAIDSQTQITAHVFADNTEITEGIIYYYLENGTVLGNASIGENFTFKPTEIGIYNIKAYFTGNDDYDASNSTEYTQITVKYPTTVTLKISNKSIHKGDEIVITLLSSYRDINITENYMNLYINNKPVNQNFYNGDSYSYIARALENISVYAVYGGSTHYMENSSQIINLEVHANEFYLIIRAEENMVKVEIPDDTEGEIIFNIDGTAYNPDYYQEGNAYVNITLTDGNHSITVSFEGDGKYEATSNSTNVKIAKTIELNVTAPDVNAGHAAFIYVTLPDDAKGYVNLTINNKTEKQNITNPIVIFKITDLNITSYPFTIYYSGDENYKPSNKEGTLKITKSTDYKINYDYVSSDEEGIIVQISVPYYLKNPQNVTLLLNGNKYSNFNNLTDNDGNYNIYISLNNPSKGIYNFTVYYPGDDYYDEGYFTRIVYYSFINNYDMNITVVNANIAENASVNIKLPDDANGNITVKILDKTFNSEVKNGIANVTVNGLNADKYNITILYSGDENYVPKNDTAQLIISKLDNYEFNLNVTKTDYDEIKTVISLPDDACENVIVKINNTAYSLQVVNGKANLTVPSTWGEYNITAIYSDDKYSLKNISRTIKIDKINNYLFNVSNSTIKVGETAEINIYLPDNAEGALITFDSNNNPYSATVENGKAVIKISNLTEGSYDFSIYYSGDDNYESKSKQTNVFVLKVNDYLIDINTDENNLIISLPDDIKNNITLSVDGKNKSVNPKNQISLSSLNLSPGNHNITVFYTGDDKYTSNSNSKLITIPKISDYLFNVGNSSISVGEVAVIGVVLPANATGNVTTTVNNVYVVNVSGGGVVFNIADLAEGIYDIKVMYSGDDVYKSGDRTSRITVSKVSDYSLELTVDGNTLNVVLPDGAEGSLTVSIDGKNTTVPVADSKAELDLSDLTPGNHNIEVFYSGDDKYTSNSNSKLITIPKISDYLFNVGNSSISVGEVAVIGVVLPANAIGNVTTTVNNTVYVVNVSGGRVAFDIADLAEGVYDIKVMYSGDDVYESGDRTSRITVSKVSDYSLELSVVDKILNIVLPDGAEGSLTVSIDGKNTTVLVADSKAEFDLSDLTPGNHNIEVFYSGDDKYTSNSNSKLVTIPKVSDYLFNVGNSSISVGEVAVIGVVLPANATGNVTTTVNNTVYVVNVSGGRVAFDIADLAEGVYDIKVMYSGDDVYESGDRTSRITVSKVSDYPLELSVVDKILNIVLPDGAEGSLTVSIDGKNTTVPVVDSKAEFDLSDLTPGNHNIEVYYSGDDKYAPASNSMLVTIPKVSDYLFNVGNSSISVGEVAVINISLPNDAQGNVTLTVGSRTYTSNISNGKATINIPNLSEGNYNLPVYYSGSEKYVNDNRIANIIISKINNYQFDVKNNNKTIEVTLPGDAKGTVAVSVNNDIYNKSISNSKAEFDLSNLKEGNHSLTITYSGDEKYTSNIKNTVIEINNENKIIITAPDVVKYYHGSERLIAEVKYSNGTGIKNENITFTINGNTYNRTTNENGSASIALNLNSGNYTANVKINNTDYKVNVMIKPTVSGENVTKIFRNATQYYAYFKDTNGNPLSNGSEVTFNINGVFYTRLVNGSEGRARLNLNLEQGTYILTAINPENNEMYTNIVTILPSLQENYDLVKYFRNASQYSLLVIGSDGKALANAQVSFNINGVFYIRTSNSSGYVNFNINLNPGEYILTAEYNGCRVSNKVTVLPVLYADDLNMKYRDGSRFTVKLVDGQGNPYSGQTVRFNINGVYYDKITNESGIADLGIRLQSGQYIITSTYAYASISNTITIRS